MDGLAKKGLGGNDLKHNKREVYSSTWMGFYTEDRRMIENLRDYLEQKYMGAQL